MGASLVGVNVTVPATLVLIAATALAGCRDEPRQSELVRPGWVGAGVEHVRGKFVGKPMPAAVTWGESQRTRWVSVNFGEPHVCNGCSRSPGFGPIRLTGATVHFAPHSTRVTTFTGRQD